jgi:hypothetical protein
MVTSSGYYDDSLSLKQATDYLRDLFCEFPFADWEAEQADGTRNSRSQAVHLAAMLSQFAGPLIPQEALRLSFIYDSNSQRSGKSLLAKMAIIPPNRMMASQGWSPKDEELRKVLDAEVLRGSRYIIFDNVRAQTYVGSQVLEGFMTSPNWTGRLLGKTQMFTAPNLATIFITGNNLSVSPDIKNRTLLVSLFVSEADVQARHVLHPIDDAWLYDKKNRHDILSALWTIVRHWDAARKPLATENLRLGYERWCQVFGGLVKFAGFGDLLTYPEEEDDEADIDTEMGDMRQLVKILGESILTADEKRRCEYNFQQVVNVAKENDLFDWMLDGKETDVYESGMLVRKDYVLKSDAKSKFGKLMKRFAPHSGEFQGPRHRLWRIGQNEQMRLIKTSSIGSAGKRKFVIEAADKAAE